MSLFVVVYGKNFDQNLTSNLQKGHNKIINNINKKKLPQNIFLSKLILKDIKSSKKDIIKRAITNHYKAKKNDLNIKDLNKMIKDIKTQKFIAKNVEKSATEALRNIMSNYIINSIRLNNELIINARLAKIQNPYNENLILANAINKSESEIINLMREYARLTNKKSRFYKRFIGGKTTDKTSEISPLVQGIIFGYDIAFDNAILGAFASYTKSRVDTLLINSKTDNHQIGGYIRGKINGFEIDARISGGISSSSLQRAVVLLNNESFTQNSGYDGFSYAINTDFGQVFRFNDNLFIKPMFGVYFNKISNQGFSEEGVLAMKFSPTYSSKAGIKLASEFRFYSSDRNFAYARAGIYKDIYKKQNIASVKFVDNNREFLLKNRAKKQNYISLMSGVNLILSQRTRMNANFGITKTTKYSYYNGTISFKFEF